ncbi:hypothetical protein [uncultured Microbacterium sp.]|nr:hypothetical protein [uncultured Microbacterium sp.]
MSKPFVFALALEALGRSEVLRFVGRSAVETR